MIPRCRTCGRPVLSGLATLTPRAVVTIRRRYGRGDISQQALALEYRVTQACIGALVRGVTWSHVGGPRTHRGRGSGHRYLRRLS